MIKTNKIILLSLTLLISSCANRHRITNEQASVQIRDYRYYSQKSDLSKVIEERNIVQKGDFLVPVNNKSVNSWIKYFSVRNKDRFERFLTNGAKYKNLIQGIFKSYDLPEDLYYVGLIESGYYLGAKSKASAVGPWQFIKSTAKRYNLGVNNKVDERKSIVKSTHAAAKYFQDLYNIFGSWELALSAYNAGEYGVIRRIVGANTRDYYELCKMKKLPRETRNYVPKVLAAMEVAKNYKKYSVRIPKNKRSKFNNLKKITLKGNYSVQEIARKAKTSVKVIREINTDLKRNTTPYYPKDGYDIYLPSNSRTIASTRSLTKIKKAKRKIAKRSKKRVKNTRVTKKRIHKVRSGDNLYSIARKYKIRFSELKKLNRISSSKIYIGQKLKIPSVSAKVHTVKKGEYLIKIARAYGKSLKHLRKINNRSFKRLLPGEKIIISYN